MTRCKPDEPRASIARSSASTGLPFRRSLEPSNRAFVVRATICMCVAALTLIGVAGCSWVTRRQIVETKVDGFRWNGTMRVTKRYDGRSDRWSIERVELASDDGRLLEVTTSDVAFTVRRPFDRARSGTEAVKAGVGRVIERPRVPRGRQYETTVPGK